ncbi:cysteine proteinase [Thozetella sp. PMI_491]|nr:cysteine proteinase [Thozetella sp. PMI_491]
MSRYTPEQLNRYFQHIGYTPKAGDVSLECLTNIQRRQLARVPFESVTLHYSKFHLLSLDPEDLFVKIVDNSRGGYCMELNTFFATVLRTLGFTLFSSGARVKGGDSFSGWDHMVNIVTIDGKRHLVDVGYGSNVPPLPVPLEHGFEFDAVLPARGKLEHRGIAEYSDPSQRLWVFSTQDDGTAPWREQTCFLDHEFLPGDFQVMNLRTMTNPTSLFVKSVVATKIILDEQAVRPVGVIILFRNYVKRRIGDKAEIIENLETEEDRVKALGTYFDIVLSAEDQRAIRGLASELRRTPLVVRDI